MSSKKDKKDSGRAVCSVWVWLQANNSDLATACEQLCLDQNLRYKYVTFLAPDDVLSKKICNEADADAQNNMISKLIIPTVVTPDMSKAGNLLGEGYDVSLSGSGGTIGGVTLMPAKDYVAMKKNGALVYKVDALPQSNGELWRPARGKKGGDEAVGGAADDDSGLLRHHVVMKCAARAAALIAVGEDYRKPYLVECARILNNMGSVSDDVAKKLDYNPMISLYILLRPYASDEVPRVSLDAIKARGSPVGSSAGVVESYLSHFPSQSAAKAAYDHACEMRTKIASSARTIPDKLKNDLPSYYSSVDAWDDEFRSKLYHCMHEICATRDVAAFRRLVCEEIPTMLRCVDVVAERTITNTATYTNNVNPRMELLTLLRFVYSSDFCYSTYCHTAAGSTTAPAQMTPGSPDYWCRNSLECAHLEQLKSITVVRLTDEQRAAIESGAIIA